MNETLYIKDKITTNNSITNDGYVAYLALLSLMRKDVSHYYINANLLAYVLANEHPASRPMIDSLNNGIINLADQNIITVSPEIDNTKKKYEWIADLSSIYGRDGFFTNIDIIEIRKILLETKHFGNALSLLRFYIYLLSTIHKKKDDEVSGVGFTSVENMCLKTGLNEKTIYSYMNKLEIYELIYVYRSKHSIVKSGSISEIPSTYGRFSDKENIIETGISYENNQLQKISRNNKNSLRSLSQKYNVVKDCIEQGKRVPYDDALVSEIYFAVKELNRKYLNESREGRYKPLLCFKNYNFYEE